ncbi:MAG: molybdopterin-dependent oxidoreductase [Minwuia sp.]|nr:molybdopterin-dependent oxidoreductase [Minwuia sp.]
MPDSAASPIVRTTCPYCGVGCGVLATARPDGSVEIKGDPDHPANFGRLCSKGAALGETLGLDGRLLAPEIDGQPATWDEAIARVADGFSRTIAEHGPDSVAFYVSGQLLTEDYYVANKLMKGFIGSGNIDTNSRLCMASAVAGHKRAFGADVVPVSYGDLEQADLVVLVGSNLAWCHPVLFQRLLAARNARPGMKIVVIDPRRTPTAELADLHLPIRSGGDVALFSNLLVWLAEQGHADAAFVAQHTNGLEDALRTAEVTQQAETEALTGLSRAQIAAFREMFAAHRKTVTVFSQGVNQAADGTDRVNAIINCHLLTGRVGRPGMGPFSITGQPNAMGGREVGGLANQLAAHMEIENPEDRARVQRFWQAPAMATRAGLKAVDLFDAIEAGRIRAVWIMATNPAVTMPDADRVRRALKACPLVVVSDVERRTDTVEVADVLMPAASWSEKDGTVTNSERRISRQRGFRPLPGAARPDWRIICDVAKAMGFRQAFDYSGPAAIFDEHARLSALDNVGQRDFDIGGLVGLGRGGFDRLSPVQWPVPNQSSRQDGQILSDGRFFTPDRKARFVPTLSPAPVGADSATFVLNTGRVRDQWHTMTRTGRSARLSQHLAEPYVALHPADAKRTGIRAADLVRLSNDCGRLVARALITDAQQPGTVFSPMHWTGQTAVTARVDALVRGVVDPVSGQPALKSSRVSVQRHEADWYGFGASLERPDLAGTDYWAAVRSGAGYRFECAGRGDVPESRLTDRFLGLASGDGLERLQFLDNHLGLYRLAAFRRNRLIGAFLAAPAPVAVEREWLLSCLGETFDEVAQRARLLAGRPADANAGPGVMVCACNNVGTRAISAAVAGGACSVQAVGKVTGAGTGCGSCQSEIGRLLSNAQVAEAV